MKFQGIRVDIRPLFFVALSTGDLDKSLIRKKYEEKKWQYFEAYQQSPYAKDPMLQCYPIEIEEYIRMVIGIYEVSEKSGNYDVLFAIIKNQHKDLYRYFNSQSLFDEQEFLKYMTKRNNGVMPEMRRFMYSMYVAAFLSFLHTKNLSLTVTTLESMAGFADTPHTPAQREKEWEENVDNIQEGVKMLAMQYDYPLPKHPVSAWEFLRSQMEEVDTKVKQGKEVPDSRIFNVQARLNALVAFGDIIESLNIDPIELQNTELTADEHRRILEEYMRLPLAGDSPNPIDFNTFYALCFYLNRLAVMYNEAKHRLLDTSEEEKFVFAKQKEAEIREREAEIQQLELETRKRVKQQREKTDAMQKELLVLQKREKAWEKERAEREKNQKELYALRSLLYRHEADTNSVSAEQEAGQFQQMLETVQRKRIVFFGGHPNWIQKTKEAFPEARFLEVDDINRKLSFIQNYDVVCINADYFNHGFYDKLMNEISKYSAELVYVRGATNQERLVKEIYEQLNV